jgi:hypothetical protein
MEAGMDGAPTGVDESEVGEQQLTPRELLNCRWAPLMPNLSNAMEDMQSIAVNGAPLSIQAIYLIAIMVNDDCAEKVGRQRQTLPWPLERRVAPTSKVATKVTTISTRLWDAAPIGAPASLSWAAAGVSSRFLGGVKNLRLESKLARIEANTVTGGNLIFRCA